jgi:thiol-disulfide isomerase/thioredoxin
MRRTLPLLLCLTGCWPFIAVPSADDPLLEDGGDEPDFIDSDGDGISDTEEELLGLDPHSDDADEDGLSDQDELIWGSDPNVADTDGDGLLDGEEVAIGCDPTLVDTDNDTYTDFDEVVEGTDPTKRKDRIYEGFWPYNPAKSDIDKPEWNSHFDVGEQFPRFKGHDQFNDRVDLYDFAQQGRKVVIDVSAEWCGPCNSMAAWLDGQEDSYDGLYPGLREAVEAGDVYWITVMSQDMAGLPASQGTTEDWYDTYTNPLVPVLEDGQSDLMEHIDLAYWPSLFALNSQMKVLSVPDTNPEEMIEALGL